MSAPVITLAVHQRAASGYSARAMLIEEIPVRGPNLATLDCVVLAGGLGTRLQSAVADRPKSMALVGGHPFLELLLLALKRHGLSRFVLATGHMGDQIETYFGTGERIDADISYSREQEPLGTGGALRLAQRHTGGSPVLVLNGDSYSRLDVPTLLQAHLQASAPVTLQLAHVLDRSRYGTVELDDRGNVVGFGEKLKGDAGWISAGIYVFERSVIDAIPPYVPLSIEMELLPQYVGRGLQAVSLPGPFVDIGTPETYRRAEHVIAQDLPAIKSTTAIPQDEAKQYTREHIRKTAAAQELVLSHCLESIIEAAEAVASAFRDRHKLLLCGNGGSAADCQHVAAEFVSRLDRHFDRPALPALALTTDTSLLTGFSNDCGYEGVFERQVSALASAGDVLVVISTSGSSANLKPAIGAAAARGVKTIGLFGEGGHLRDEVDILIEVPFRDTQTVQECMLPIEHVVCALVERSLFGSGPATPGTPTVL